MQFRRQSLNLNTILYQCRVIILLQQLLDVRLPVQDLPNELDIGKPSLLPVILQAPAADLQCPGKLPVGQAPIILRQNSAAARAAISPLILRVLLILVRAAAGLIGVGVAVVVLVRVL